MTRAARLLLVVAALLAAAPTSASAAGASTAVVVIDTGASVRSAVIHFDGSINGIDALVLAGGNPTTYGFSGNGAAVCSIDGVGNPANQSCLIGPNGEYWAYYLATGGATRWSYSRGCACTTTVNDGDVQGWRYGTGAAPRSSADFCAYVACAPPPTTATTLPAPAPGVGPVTTVPYQPPVAPSSQPAGTSPQSGGSGTTASRPAITGAEPGSVGATTTSTPPTTTTKGSRDGKDVRVEAAAVHRKAGGGGVGGDSTGSPTGVAIAAGALAATAGVAVWLRRRRVRA